MDTQRPIRSMICHVCQRPAMAMDASRVPYCGRHALMLGALVQLSSVRDESTGVMAGGFERSAAASG